MTLRAEVVEAMAQAWLMAKGPSASPSSIPWEHLNPGLRRQYLTRCEAALDAALDVLGEQVEAWWLASGGTIYNGEFLIPKTATSPRPGPLQAIAALRAGKGSDDA